MATEPMNMDMAVEISDIIEMRQDRFDEPLATSIKVVLFGYGDSRRIAHCIFGDWSGPKSEMVQAKPNGIPLCPVCRRPATEDENGWGLALVESGITTEGTDG